MNGIHGFTLTSIDGVEVVTTEPAMGPHPRWRWEQPIVVSGVVKALLANDKEFFVCTHPGCTFHNADVVSVMNHRNGTHNRKGPAKPITQEDAIRALLREVTKARRAGGRNWNGRAAEALNAASVPSATGKEWNGSMVSRLYNKYKDKYRVRTSTPRAGTPAKAGKPQGGSDNAIRGLLQVHENLEGVLQDLATAIARLLERPPADPALVEKAAKWDQLQSLMG